MRQKLISGQRLPGIKFLLIVMLLGVMVFFGVLGYLFIRFKNAPGWIRNFSDEIPTSNNLPSEFTSLTLNQKSLTLTGKSGIVYALNQDSGNEKWRFFGNDYSIYPAAYDNNILYLTGFDGRLYALDSTSGREMWRFSTPEFLKADTEPVISDNLVYFGSRNGTFYALDKLTGVVKWEFETGPIDQSQFSFGRSIIHFGRFSVDENQVFINSSADNSVYALDKKTGQLIWQYPKYGFTFEKLQVFPNNISFWGNQNIFRVVSKNKGQLIYQKTIAPDQTTTGKNRFYFWENHKISSINMIDGTLDWQWESTPTSKMLMLEVGDNNFAAIAGSTASATLTMINPENGQVLWQASVEKPVQKILTHDNLIILVGDSRQCAYEIKDGANRWCSDIYNSASRAMITEAGLMMMVEKDKIITLYNIDLSSGVMIWKYSSDKINPDIIKTNSTGTYFFTRDGKSLIMLKNKLNQNQITEKNLLAVGEPSSSLPKLISKIKNFNQFLAKLLIKPVPGIIYPGQPVQTYQIFELSLILNDTAYQNPQDLPITVVFTHENQGSIPVKGFYYDKNVWKIRFAPTVPGRWKWSIDLKEVNINFRQTGSFEVLSGTNPGFVRISQNNPKNFVLDSGVEHFPIGIQDCLRDHNHDGDFLSMWFPAISTKPPTTNTFAAQSMEHYLSLYQQSGFNTFRFGVGNCSYNLWQEFAPNQIRYNLNTGFLTDELFRVLKKHGYKIWMSLMSFSMPFDHNQYNLEEEKQMLSDYLDYAVARYGAYVDVWELGNEIYLGDDLINFMSQYLKSIDPYQHPVTISYERPDLTSIDITSVHWYDGECDLYCDKNLEMQLGKFKDVAKPLVLSELGNRFSNSDDQSADRMRVRLWIGFMKNVSVIFWNATMGIYQSPQGASNIYLGPIERQYISVFNRFTGLLKDDSKFGQITTNNKNVKASYLTSTDSQLIYFYYRIYNQNLVTADFDLDLTKFAMGQWINPQNGNVVGNTSLKPGLNRLTTPGFLTDLVLLIKLID